MTGSRRWIAATLAAVAVAFALISTGPVTALAASKPSVNIPSGLLMTMDGHVLWSRHPNTERRVASTIKLLNALVVRDRAKLDETVTVTAKAARTPSGVGLWKGEKLTVRRLLQMMLIPSANDAAEALAIHIGGTEANYVKLMNAKAKSLGLKHTHAVDPHGLSKKEHSTANDLSVLARKVMADSVLRKIVGMHSVKVPLRNGKTSIHASTDQLFGHYKGIEGVKTGFTNPAGYCFIAAAKRGRVELLSVVLGAESLSGRFSQTRKVLDWGFAGFKVKRVVSADTTIGIVGITGGVVPTDSVHPSRNATCAVWTRGAPLTRVITLPAHVIAPVHRGDQLGVVREKIGSWTLVSVGLLANSSVASAPTTPTPPATVPTASVPTATSSVAPSGSTLWRRLWTALSAGLLWGRTAGSS